MQSDKCKVKSHLPLSALRLSLDPSVSLLGRLGVTAEALSDAARVPVRLVEYYLSPRGWRGWPVRLIAAATDLAGGQLQHSEIVSFDDASRGERRMEETPDLVRGPCRVCGCEDGQPCEQDGRFCHWVTQHSALSTQHSSLCSFCADDLAADEMLQASNPSYLSHSSHCQGEPHV